MQAGQNWGRRWRGLAAMLGLCALLGGCGEEAGAPAPTGAAQAVPADAALAQLYGASCRQCHANPAAGAPLTGDAVAWTPRLAKGLDTLLEHSINGFQGMPPMGLCMQCTEQEFRALIEFMAAVPTEGR
ncbi:cytochrome c5 family protein [Pseudomonas sp. R-28-1W-6]|uniref:c-type cytochrome n=1 Tax=Pseudomonas sp. R-28-1W-6 TaxID=2650101 RepID=UPI001365C2F7|nr:c-type cytochrome [Pseudomonas sp. R-28-1W-6]MWV11904.1 cytochrome c5 family protein [Pseudomonas sp. R-28-1W-6]